MLVQDIVARLLETEDFDPRAYLLGADWEEVLAKRGWERGPFAPRDMVSFKKSYHSPAGWYVTVWVEQDKTFPEGDPRNERVNIAVFGPNGDSLLDGCVRLEHYEALGKAEEIEKVLYQDLPYDQLRVALNKVFDSAPAKLVNKLLEVEEFDAREYILNDPTWEALQRGLIEMGWRFKELSYQVKWGKLFVKDTPINGVECRIYAYIEPEPPFTVVMVVEAFYDHHTKEIDQMNSECQMAAGESMTDYLKDISDLEAGLTVPSQEEFDFEG